MGGRGAKGGGGGGGGAAAKPKTYVGPKLTGPQQAMLNQIQQTGGQLKTSMLGRAVSWYIRTPDGKTIDVNPRVANMLTGRYPPLLNRVGNTQLSTFTYELNQDLWK